MDILDTLQLLGITLPSTAYLVGAVLFGIVGMVAFRWGGRKAHARTRWLGVLLMAFPYGVSTTWVLYLVGVALCAGVLISERGSA